MRRHAGIEGSPFVNIGAEGSAIGDVQSLKEVFAGAARGDERAWRAVVHRYKRLVYSIPREYKFADDACDDIFQTVFAAFVRELPRINDPQAVPKWLITTTHRACWKAAKAAQSAGFQLEPSAHAAEPQEDAVERWERVQQLESALSSLGGRCEVLLRLLYLSSSEVSYEEIGRQVGMAVGSIGPTRTRCLAKLADLMA